MNTRVLLGVTVSALGVSLTIAGCGGGSAAPTAAPPPPPSPSAVSVTISPKNVDSLPAEGTQAFTATVTGSSNKTVTWSVQEGAVCGSIDAVGKYSAPNSPGAVCHVVATSEADSTRSDTATVTISQLSIYVLPFQVSLGAGQMQTFKATVEGTTNTSVTWSIKEGATGGTITGEGIYSAPQTLGIFHVIATSQADSRFTASAEVDVIPVGVSISPAADTLGPLDTRTFAASVVGTNQAGVSWNVQEGASGGSITSGGVYTAPQNLGTFHVVATNVADGTASASAVVSVVASGFASANPLSQSRLGHTATPLSDGRVLVAGGMNDSGCLSSAEIFNPADNSFSDSSDMNDQRSGHSATELSDGRILITGGFGCASIDSAQSNLASAELYNPTTGAFALTGSMSTARVEHTSTRLTNGNVLITGGYADASRSPLASAELYDPSKGTFTLTGSMQKPRIGHSATLLADGRVLIAGGQTTPPCGGCFEPDSTAELYDPATGLFKQTGDMSGPLAEHTASRLKSGLVLIAGGYFCGTLESGGAGSECATSDVSNQAMLYDPVAGAFSTTGSMAYGRAGHSATLLSNGNILIAGGLGEDPATEAEDVTFTAELYDPATGLFTRTGSMALARSGHTATLISNGRVLIAGGSGNDGSALPSTEIYK
jgi:hypothetical protein